LKLTLFILATMAACGPLKAEDRSADRQPNILFLLADDQRNDELACAGEPFLRTPNIDRLADQGVRFENAFVTTSICMVSRASLFTGLSQRTLEYGPGNPRSKNLSEAMLETSFPTLLREAGYRTGYFGKNHVTYMGGNRRAFDRMFDDWKHIGRNPYFKEQPDGSKRHTAELIGDRSVAFLESQPKDRPFFLFMSFNVPHAEDKDHRPGIGHFPWPRAEDGLYEDIVPPRPELDDPAVFEALPPVLKDSLNRTRWFWRWDTIEKYNTNMRARYRMITGMDRVIGRVLAVLEERGLAENTVVVYSADNGYYRGERGLAGKWTHFDESLRVPLIITDPREPEPRRGGLLDPFVLNLDLPPTFLDLAGLEIPATYQGRSLLPLLDKSDSAPWRDEFFAEHHQFGKVIPAWSGVRNERFMYAVYDAVDPPVEFLHDLERDPKQLENLAEDPEYREVLDALRNRREAYLAEYREARSALRPEKERAPRPSAPAEKDAGEKSVEGGEITFDGDDYRKLGETPPLDVGDSYAWQLEVRIAADNDDAGAILMGNRETPGARGTNFLKITADRGVQIFGGSRRKSLVLEASLPKEQWIDVKLEKQGETFTLYVDGSAVASGTVDFALPAMPCYLGGDPNYGEFARCSVRHARTGKRLQPEQGVE